MITFFPSRAVALELWGFAIHWYGIMYLCAFLIAGALLPRLQRYRDMTLTRDEWLNVLTSLILGVILGGRLGYVLFYAPVYFVAHPWEIFAVWNGGMSFHGGLLGVALAVVLVCRRKHLSLLRVADVIVVPAAIGLALGRVGNFINLELYGTVTDLPWAIAIPGVEGLRHPTQLYAVGKDVCIAAFCLWHLRRTHGSPSAEGRTFAFLLMLYGIGRFLIEFLRVQEYPLTVVLGMAFTRGQLLTIPVFVAGVGLWIWTKKRENTQLSVLRRKKGLSDGL